MTMNKQSFSGNSSCKLKAVNQNKRNLNLNKVFAYTMWKVQNWNKLKIVLMFELEWSLDKVSGLEYI